MSTPRPDYTREIEAVLAAPNAYLDASLRVFSGPSIDLHHWAMEARSLALTNSISRDRFLRAVYAALSSWGMHRMGNTQTKMPRYRDFEESITSQWRDVSHLWRLPAPLAERDWEAAFRIYQGLKASLSTATLVANSKTMFHLFPHLFAPIDRTYTLELFRLRASWQRRVRAGGIRYEWDMFRNLHECFFWPLTRDSRFPPIAEREFCTSLLKVADNLVVGRVTLGH